MKQELKNIKIEATKIENFNSFSSDDVSRALKYVMPGKAPGYINIQTKSHINCGNYKLTVFFTVMKTGNISQEVNGFMVITIPKPAIVLKATNQ